MPRMSKKRKQEWALFLNEKIALPTTDFVENAVISASRVSVNIYEISYDFINVDGKNDESNHYYYLKNGEPVKMAADFYNHFSANKIEEMCGLKLYIGQKNLG